MAKIWEKAPTFGGKFEIRIQLSYYSCTKSEFFQHFEQFKTNNKFWEEKNQDLWIQAWVFDPINKT